MKTKMKFYRRFFSALFIASLLMACSKDGNDGTNGAPGPQGEQGPAGADGADGQNGDTNVIFSEWVNSGFPADVMDTEALFDIDAPALTQEFRDTGVILVYARTGSITYGLPVVFAEEWEHSYFFRVNVPGTLEIAVNSTDGSNVGATAFLQYRYVLVPGGLAAKSASTVNFSKMTYEEVAAYFGIKD